MQQTKPSYCYPCGTKGATGDQHKDETSYDMPLPTGRHESASGVNVEGKPSTPHTEIAELARAVLHYKEIVRTQARRMLDFERKIHEQQETIENLHTQKDDIVDDFWILRQKYDDVKAHLDEVLWGVLPSGFIPGVEGNGSRKLEGIPPLTHDIVESPTRIGGYEILELLGEGQFASVRAIRPLSKSVMDESSEAKIKNGLERGRSNEPSSASSSPQRAVKVIKKADVVSLTTLRRLDNEIDVLRLLQHEGVMKLHEVIHAPGCLYMVTDRAGRDLFDFFDEHLEGISEDAACLLMHKIITPLHYCHSMGVVHRDLKPENVLFADKEPLTAATHVVLCDFGLCARVGTPGTESDKNVLSEFCGSPGFFAPEMLIQRDYDGRKADVWSLGCILLELVLGHDYFCRLWMTAYDREHLKPVDCAAFETSIRRAVMNLKQELPLHVSPALCRFLLEALDLDSNKRLTSEGLLHHDWMAQSGLSITDIEETNQRERGDRKKSMPEEREGISTEEIIHLRQDHESVCEHRARSLSPLPCTIRGGISTSLRRLEGEFDRELSPQRGIAEPDHIYIYRKDTRNLGASEVTNAKTGAAQPQTIGDRSWREMVPPRRGRRAKTLSDTPTILVGNQRARSVHQHHLEERRC